MTLARRRITGVEVVVVTPSSQLRYSGMLPGWIAGHYALDELTVDFEALVRAAGARFITASIRKLDLDQRVAFTERDEPLTFDVLSIATGAVIDVNAVAGAPDHALPLRPFDSFVAGWQHIMQRAEAAREAFRLTVIGGGAGGAEIALAATYRMRKMRRQRTCG